MDIFLTSGSSYADVQTFGAKCFGFFENYGVSAQTRGGLG